MAIENPKTPSLESGLRDRQTDRQTDRTGQTKKQTDSTEHSHLSRSAQPLSSPKHLNYHLQGPSHPPWGPVPHSQALQRQTFTQRHCTAASETSSNPSLIEGVASELLCSADRSSNPPICRNRLQSDAAQTSMTAKLAADFSGLLTPLDGSATITMDPLSHVVFEDP